MTTKTEHSITIGKYLGPVLSLLIISEIINFHIWKSPTNPQLVYLNGFVLLLFGFYIIRVHNLWIKDWPVFITLSGWFFTVLGVMRMFFPEAQQAGDNTPTFVGLVILTAIELYVTFKAYSSKN
jgi:hypothetical protein